MTPTLFLQSAIDCPYELYERMLEENPVYQDTVNGLWAVYSYEECKTVLSNPFAQIPAIINNELNEHSLLIQGKLARLSNESRHEIARHTIMLLFQNMKEIDTGKIVKELIGSKKQELDWVNSIAIKLPLIVVLKSFDFSDDDCHYISTTIKSLVKIMGPIKTQEQLDEVNGISKEIYSMVESHLLQTNFYKYTTDSIKEKHGIDLQESIAFCVSNLVGLLIQCYDAGRGILCNTLLQLLKSDGLQENNNSKEYFQKSVIETLRIDPPVQNTRRVATSDIILLNNTINKGETIFIVLAAANRDSQKFIEPNRYDIDRSNNSEHLTFGVGGHRCPANQFSVNLATDALFYLFNTYQSIQLIEKKIAYEPLINVRLPKNISISLS